MELDYHNIFYINYFRLEHTAYRDKVRYFENHKRLVHKLTEDQQQQMKIDYVICLFEIGRYDTFLRLVDQMIELVVIENIYSYNGKEIFNELLFRKSAALYNVKRYEEAEKVAKALTNIDRTDKKSRMLFKKCRRKYGVKRNENLKAISVLILITAIAVAYIELLIVKPFYQNYTHVFRVTKMILFCTGIGILISRELVFRYSVGRDIGFRLGIMDGLASFNKFLIDISGGKIKQDPL